MISEFRALLVKVQNFGLSETFRESGLISESRTFRMLPRIWSDLRFRGI